MCSRLATRRACGRRFAREDRLRSFPFKPETRRGAARSGLGQETRLGWTSKRRTTGSPWSTTTSRGTRPGSRATNCTVCRSAPIFNSHAIGKRVPVESLAFFLDGSPISGDQTPEDLGLEGGDRIDCARA